MFEVFATIAAAMETNQSFGFYSTFQNTTAGDLYWDTVFPYLKPHLFHKPIKVKLYYNERGFLYKPFSHLLQPYRGSACQINGYFQKVKYFEHLFYDIVKLLHLDEIRQQVYDRVHYNIVPRVNWQLTVCMHFRLGDYVQQLKSLPLMPYTYYLDALTAIVSQYPEVTTVMYFCEKGDVDIVQPKVLDLSMVFPHLTFQKVPDGLQDYEELFVMSFCQHHIIANSTFSFWGALLQDSSAPKMVCYPSLWFGPAIAKSGYNFENTFPETWTQILVSP